MTGYQEVLTDPSYRGQIVVMTQPHIGNYGTTPEVAESERPWVEGFIARQFTARFSGSVGDESLVSYLRRHGVPALQGLDTRAVVRRLRERGALRGVLTTERSDVEALSAEVAAFPTMEGRALVDEVTCAAPYEIPAVGEERRHLAVYDFGVKANILRSLAERGARLTVLPARTPAKDVLALPVDGVVLSNGPGDPEPLTGIIENVRELVAARCLSSASAWVTSSSGWPWAGAPSSSSSAITGGTSRCATWRRARWRSPARTTASPSIPSRCRPPAPSPRSTSTTARSRGSPSWTSRCGPCSTTRRPLPVPTTPRSCSTVSSTRRRGDEPPSGRSLPRRSSPMGDRLAVPARAAQPAAGRHGAGGSPFDRAGSDGD